METFGDPLSTPLPPPTGAWFDVPGLAEDPTAHFSYGNVQMRKYDSRSFVVRRTYCC